MNLNGSGLKWLHWHRKEHGGFAAIKPLDLRGKAPNTTHPYSLKNVTECSELTGIKKARFACFSYIPGAASSQTLLLRCQPQPAGAQRLCAERLYIPFSSQRKMRYS